MAEVNFLEYLATDEQNLLTSIINFRSEFDAFYKLDNLYQEPMRYIKINKENAEDEAIIPCLFKFVHFHLYFSVSCLFRGHFSECLASTRSAIDASLTAYQIILYPDTQVHYKNRAKPFLAIKTHIRKERKKDDSKYPNAKNLLDMHETCSEYGSHADISTFIHRVDVGNPRGSNKPCITFYYHQLPKDKDEYAALIIDTLLAFCNMLQTFRDFLIPKIEGASPDWPQTLNALGMQLYEKKNSLYSNIKRNNP